MLAVEDPVDPFFWPLHFQVAPNWLTALRQHFTGNSHALDLATEVVAMCRWWDDRLTNISSLSLNELSSLLGKPIDALAASTPPGLTVALNAIDAYLQANVTGVERDSEWEGGALDEGFIHLYLSLIVLICNLPHDSRIDRLALAQPDHTPAFDGPDLWLKRRALRGCVQRDGAAFLSRNAEALRLEDLADLLISSVLQMDDLLVVRALLDNKEWFETGLAKSTVEQYFATKGQECE
ncbi:hypothetical protein ACNPM2_03825 [Stenotrophomonas geniculata]|uniref:hypothetical protein n=1 Tax=Stenotrophomonas TaxID=40323 RepID=UPI00177FF435|nr:hypothetical protein [Stenotrophomonas sp. AS012628]